MPIRKYRKTNRRSRRVSRRRHSRRNSTRKYRMRGGVQHAIRFTVILVNDEGDDMNHTFVNDHKQDIVMKFQQIASAMTQKEGNEEPELNDSEIQKFEFEHIEDDIFQMKFEFLVQGLTPQALALLRKQNVDRIFDKFADETIEIDGDKYDINIESDDNNNNNNNNIPAQPNA